MNNSPAEPAPPALSPCPRTPNCVSSQADDAQHQVAPLAFNGPPAEALLRLDQVLAAMQRTQRITRSSTYLHYTFRSAVFRFVDDVECLLDPAVGVIHIRSASRTGRSDFGVNRRRVERIRAAFAAAE